MKRICCIIIILFIVFFCIANKNDSVNSEWDKKFYLKYDYESFINFKPALKRIDMNKIDYPLLHACVFYESCRQRVLNGKKPFLNSIPLEIAASAHSIDMAKYNFFSHSSPVPGKETMSKRLALVDISNGYTGENIAYTFGIEYEAGKSVFTPDQNSGYFSYSYKGEPILNHTYIGLAKSVLNNWMNSPGHRANILSDKFKYLGCGAAHYQDKNFYNIDMFKFTQNFSNIDSKI